MDFVLTCTFFSCITAVVLNHLVWLLKTTFNCPLPVNQRLTGNLRLTDQLIDQLTDQAALSVLQHCFIDLRRSTITLRQRNTFMEESPSWDQHVVNAPF